MDRINSIINENKIDEIPSGESYEDMGYGNLLLHVALQGIYDYKITKEIR